MHHHCMCLCVYGTLCITLSHSLALSLSCLCCVGRAYFTLSYCYPSSVCMWNPNITIAIVLHSLRLLLLRRLMPVCVVARWCECVCGFRIAQAFDMDLEYECSVVDFFSLFLVCCSLVCFWDVNQSITGFNMLTNAEYVCTFWNCIRSTDHVLSNRRAQREWDRNRCFSKALTHQQNGEPVL